LKYTLKKGTRIEVQEEGEDLLSIIELKDDTSPWYVARTLMKLHISNVGILQFGEDLEAFTKELLLKESTKPSREAVIAEVLIKKLTNNDFLQFSNEFIEKISPLLKEIVEINVECVRSERAGKRGTVEYLKIKAKKKCLEEILRKHIHENEKQ
jgi:hypothetical protein